MSGRWRAWMALAALRFGLAPEAFWRLGVSEWLALCAALAPERTSPPERARLEALIAAHPDDNGSGKTGREG